MKWIRRLLLCALLAAVGLASTACSVYRESAALLPGIEFGMSAAQAKAVLGEPDGEEQITGMNDLTYTWLTYENVHVQGHPAAVRLKFAPDWRGTVLIEFTITFASEEKAALLAELDAALAAELAGFSRRERTDGVDYDMNRGPVGTWYMLKIRENDVWLHGECNEYSR
ncbi:MAG: hypothetical protein IJE07_11100 [Clostridia bacterium]|nr:hypothetical protein [Clostridia bacterium]